MNSKGVMVESPTSPKDSPPDECVRFHNRTYFSQEEDMMVFGSLVTVDMDVTQSPKFGFKNKIELHFIPF